MIIEVQDLSFSYEPNSPILEKINFTVEKGAFIGIFGPNGGGKTTLLKLLLGLVRPTKGTIQILGESPRRASPRAGYVPQMRRFDKHFPITALDVVLQGLLAEHRGWGSYRAEAKDAACGALEQVGLADCAHKPFGQLSGGQSQRVLLARALVAKPEILFLDEATVGIDPDALHEIFRLLRGLKGEMTILLVTHDLQAIGREMDHLLCINRQLTEYAPDAVCGHFALGLYHPPLFKEDKPS